MPWTLIANDNDAAQFAARLDAGRHMSLNWSSISGGLDFAAPLFDNNGYEGARLVIDISGDGRNNQGRPAELARDNAVARGIVVNGLPNVTDRPNFGQPQEFDLDGYYRSAVIGRPGAFMIVAHGFADFTNAILSKLIREIAGDPPARAAAE